MQNAEKIGNTLRSWLKSDIKRGAMTNVGLFRYSGPGIATSRVTALADELPVATDMRPDIGHNGRFANALNRAAICYLPSVQP